MQDRVIVREISDSDFNALVNYNDEKVSIEYGGKSISIPIHQFEAFSDFVWSVRYHV